ncbi:hypothetical protein JCM19296_127 [Nonlabens ulvanivorans]|uniref:Uncharacterized protein n=1 Tax=Nonlabens ulvanivorans TaxID=906888 RepID=A0A081D6K3_NONUL|nr:hypothetical protein [Nonlabens ulvanivorans]GAK74549.1 hypothetical protein JCM19296_127 [Nonlabens ulvanivorans]
MEKEELKFIISRLRKDNTEEDSFFGVLQYGGGPDESMIKANRKGLRLYAAELLEASITDSENNTIPFNSDWTYDNADFFFDYIEISEKVENKEEQESRKNNKWLNTLFTVGCISVILALIIFIIVGGYTVLNWLL